MRNSKITVTLRRTMSGAYKIEKLVNAERITVVSNSTQKNKIVRVDDYISSEQAQSVLNQGDMELVILGMKE